MNHTREIHRYILWLLSSAEAQRSEVDVDFREEAL